MSKYGIKDITILYYRHNLISLMTSCITMPSYKYYVSDIIKSQLFLFLIAVCSVKTLAIVYNYVPQTKFGRHIVFAPFLIIILLLLSFFLPPKVYPTHFSATSERKSMKLHRNVKHYE
jgi:hypothetical protein